MLVNNVDVDIIIYVCNYCVWPLWKNYCTEWWLICL